ncbi:hypothetical protein [Bacteriovorax sp. Seq25_V]|uniref:hypothetical protein n=1 Tax=Bacteriovorax sp. Seq25_V TaxID=1201288 RepID=UPI00038A06C6|nr:hypothetical protein [Bacteriovorax sp. Seq25_V]EQC44250.1 hypothetical protein M900_A0360 [Bacteriovorax sp. Seq25_V]
MHFKKLPAIAVLATSYLCSFNSSAKDLEKFYFKNFSYEEYVYSDSKKTEVGDTVELELDVAYDYSENTKFTLGFETYPEDNRFNNKTSKFELVASHKYENVKFSIDGELQTNEPDNNSGGTSIGADLDSDKTYIKYNMSKSVALTYFPFNFDGEVGEEFNTWDVTRIYYFEGTPSSISGTISDDEKVAQKTIPGLVLSYEGENGLDVYAGIGKATFLYPGNANFNLSSNPNATRWERKETTGIKAGISYAQAKEMKVELKYVTQDKSEQTGALLQSAASVYGLFNILDSFLFEAEVTYSKAGKAPWNVNRSKSWFDKTAPFQPIYADSTNKLQDWIGKSDTAYAVKLAYMLDDVTPYVFYRYQGEHFIFRERESAHILRTADDSKSHGGLSRFGLGSYFKKGKFTINPEFEMLRAKNPVFSSSSDVRDDRLLSTFKKNDYLLYIKVDYNFDGSKLFAL